MHYSPPGTTGTLDGQGAGDRDQLYVFGRRPSSNLTAPFTTHQYARLLLLRSRVQAGLFGADDVAHPEGCG